jgi:histidyl-tRNA synthetase
MTEFQTVRGMRDFLPEQAAKKQYIEDICRQVFESYGFQPVETPAVEGFELLAKKGSAGEAIKDEIYYFKDKGDRELGLRFDLTVPTARVVASNPQLQKPFKRYQIDRVWRYDRPQAQRYREFTQADYDIFGTKSTLADFEIVAVTVDVLKKLGIKGKVVVNDRRILEEVAEKNGVKKEQITDCFRSIDKLDKIEMTGVEKELKDKGINAKILGQLDMSLEKLEKDIPSSVALKDLKKLFALAKETGIQEYVQFDLSLARGLEYYTGIVFEVKSGVGPSIGGGGRYDKLIETYGGPATPAVGSSFGIDRILDVVDKQLPSIAPSKLFVAAIGEEAVSEVVKIAGKMRQQGIAVEVDLMARSPSKNMEYANKKGIAFAAFVGEKELSAKEFELKNLKTGKAIKVKFSEIGKVAELVK